MQYNPNSLAFDKKPKHASINIPGLDAPLQAIRAQRSRDATVELFFDSTEQGTGAGAKSVTELTDPFVGLVKIDPATHAPPICSFAWGKKFPGDSLPERYKNQRRTEFKGVVTDVKQDYKLFNPEGTPLRALLTLTLDEYRPLHQQLKELNLMSADHSRPTCSSAATRSRSWRGMHLDDAGDLAPHRRRQRHRRPPPPRTRAHAARAAAHLRIAMTALTRRCSTNPSGQGGFYVPRFEVKIEGVGLPRDVLFDVSRLTYEDSIDEIDSFSMTVNNWDDERAHVQVHRLGDAGPAAEG